MSEIIVTTSNEISGKKVKKFLGIVRGNTARSKNIVRDVGAILKHLVGGEIKTYTQMISNSRDEAYKRMVDEAVNKGADAIIGVRFMTSMIMAGVSEMFAYGTAVKLK